MKLFISRKQYDQLIDTAPKFMRDEYTQLVRAWGVGGVVVTGNRRIVRALIVLLDGIK